jgi:hypothetical protein
LTRRLKTLALDIQEISANGGDAAEIEAADGTKELF